MKTMETKIDEVYEELFEFIIKSDQFDDDMYDLVIEYKEAATGKTIRRSWKDRDERLVYENTE